jgi:hypothetical protein
MQKKTVKGQPMAMGHLMLDPLHAGPRGFSRILLSRARCGSLPAPPAAEQINGGPQFQQRVR